MGMSVFNQVDNNKYFSLSTINKTKLVEMGINLPVSKFREIAKRSPPFTSILTGSDVIPSKSRRTNIYKYDDFKYLAGQ